jgi:hypothetical protein
MLTPKLIPIEQLEKAEEKAKQLRLYPQPSSKEKKAGEGTGNPPLSRLQSTGGDDFVDPHTGEEFDINDLPKDQYEEALWNAKPNKKESLDQKMQKALASLEKAARQPNFTTSRERKARAGSKGTGFGAAAHTGDTSWSVNMEKSSLYKAFGVQTQDRSQPSPLFLQKNINLQKNMDEYLDVYDEILQKADMDWDNVTDEDFARLEKIDLGRFFGRGKKEEAPKKESGDRAAAAEKVQAGIREAQAKQEGKRTEEARRAGLSDVDRRREDVSSSMKTVKEGRAEKLARGIGRFGGRVKEKVDQRENIGRKIAETKDTGIARGKQAVASTKAGVAEGRRRGGVIRNIATTAARSSGDVATSGQVKPKVSGSGLIGANKTPQDHTERFKPKTYDNPYRRMKQDQAKQAASRASNPTPQQGVDAAAAKRKAMAGGLAMSKAVVSLQKYLDDCGCEGDTLMQNKDDSAAKPNITRVGEDRWVDSDTGKEVFEPAPTSAPKTPEEKKAWEKDYYQDIKHKG